MSEERELLPGDLRIDTFSEGVGVNGRSAVRITHLPSGVRAESNYYKSQLRNKEEALALLRHRLTRVDTMKTTFSSLREAEKEGDRVRG